MYKHILFATELNETKSYIEDKVAQLQQLTNAKVSVIHVVEPIPEVYYGGVYGVVPNLDATDTTKLLEERAKEKLEPLAKRLNISAKNLHVPIGHISSEILAFAENEQVDLIITGSHGVHGLQLLLGSTSNAILHGAKCDVLAVRFTE